MTDAELIARVVVSDDHAAFGELVRRHQSAVRHFLRHLMSGDAAQADDLAQETFIRAYRLLARFENRSGFPTWVLGIAHNLWRNARRRVQPVALEPEHLALLEPSPSPAAASDLKHDLAQALCVLGPEERDVFHLHYQQGLSHEEIAGVLGFPLGTVKTHLNRGRDKLRPLLQPWHPNSTT